MRAPAVTVGPINSPAAAQSGGVAEQGMNQPPPPTGHTKAARSFSVGTTRQRRSKGAAECPLRWRRCLRPLITAATAVLHGGCHSPPPAPFDCRRPLCSRVTRRQRRCWQCPLITAGATADAARCHPLSLIAAALRIHGGKAGDSDQREPWTQVSVATVNAPFDRWRCKCLRRRCQRCPLITTAVSAMLHAVRRRRYVTALSAFFSLTSLSSGPGPDWIGPVQIFKVTGPVGHHSFSNTRWSSARLSRSIGVAVNSTHGQLDTCVELTHLPKSQLDTRSTLHTVNSTH